MAKHSRPWRANDPQLRGFPKTASVLSTWVLVNIKEAAVAITGVTAIPQQINGLHALSTLPVKIPLPFTLA